MKDTLGLSILCLLLVSIGICRTASVDNIKPSDYEYDYDDDEEIKSSDSDPTQASKTSNAPPYFERPNIELNAIEGDNVLFECNVRNFKNDSNAIMWYKDKTLISIGRDPVSNHYESLENNSIRIKKVTLDDAGDYFCTVLPQNVRLHIALKVESGNVNNPYFDKNEMEIGAMQGENVVLDCEVRNFNNDPHSLRWYKGNTLISHGHKSIDNHYESFKNNSIRINNVVSTDFDDYYCIVEEKARLHIKLKMKGLQILCNGLDVTNGRMNKKQGASFSCECISNIPGDVEIKWSINGVRAENIVTKLENAKFYVDNADSDHEGIYQCLGDDHSPKPAIVALDVKVNYQPKVSTHRHHVNTEIGGKAELYCDYKANPIGIVRWRKNNVELNFSEKYSIKNTVHHNRNRTMLEIKNVNEDDIGEYECHVENTIGSNDVKVFLILEPEAPQFEDMEIDGNRVKLHWLVRSAQALSEAILDYKMSGSFTWTTVAVLSTKRHTQDGEMWKLTHEMELSPGKWHARVKTRNTVNWSKFSAPHDFIIEEVDDDNDETNNLNKEIPPQDMVMAAGIGLDKSKNASPKVQSQIAFVIFATLIIAIQSLLAKSVNF